MIGLSTGVTHALLLKPIGEPVCHIGWIVAGQQSLAADLIEKLPDACKANSSVALASAALLGDDVAGVSPVRACRTV